MGELHPTLALPGDWWRVDLTDSSEAVAVSIKRYVERQAGRADDRAQYRAALRDHLRTAISEASRAGARAMYFSSEIAVGVPIAITLTTYHTDLPQRLSWDSGVGVAAESFAGSLHETEPEALIGVWSDDDVAVVRDVRIRILTAENGDQAVSLRVDYWLFRAGQQRPWLFAFGTPLIWDEELEPMVGMLDAIVSTVSWEIDAGIPAAAGSVPST